MSRKRNSKQPAVTMRCAVYTRKSTEEGLDQEFNSLDAQRESAEAYIASQQHEGWGCLPDQFVRAVGIERFPARLRTNNPTT